MNEFQEIASWTAQAPGIAYSLVAGPISDHVGLKPLLVLPITGAVIGAVFQLSKTTDLCILRSKIIILVSICLI